MAPQMDRGSALLAAEAAGAEGLTTNECAALFGLDRSTAARNLRRLHQTSRVLRWEEQIPGRETHLRWRYAITAKGLRALAHFRAIATEALGDPTL